MNADIKIFPALVPRQTPMYIENVRATDLKYKGEFFHSEWSKRSGEASAD